MPKGFLFDRHKALWNEHNKRIKRTIIGGLVFGTLLLFTVLEPLSADLNKRIEYNNEIEKFARERQNIEESIKALGEFEQTLKNVTKTIEEEPWKREIYTLIENFRSMNIRGEGNRKRYQKEADSTILNVKNQVSKMVIEPLDKALLKIPMAAELMPEFSEELKTSPKVVNSWVDKLKGENWYSTIDEKTNTIDSLTKDLRNQTNKIVDAIKDDGPKLTTEKLELSKKIEELENNKDLKATEDLLEDLEARMEKILPPWLRGMISIYQMIQLYPFIILGLVIYVFVIALLLSFHYQSMIKELKFAREAKKNPTFSSLWTLTTRGRFGTILTIVTYFAFVTAMWILFEKGFNIFGMWVKSEGGFFSNKISLSMISNACRCFFLITALLFILIPFNRNNEIIIIKHFLRIK